MFVAYPLIPWIGVTAVGYGLGRVYAWDAERRRRVPAAPGAGRHVPAFLVLRGINVYGDPSRWTRADDRGFTVLRS